MKTAGSESSSEEVMDAAALESAGRYEEAAVEHRRYFEALRLNGDGSTSGMAAVALDIARCLEKAGHTQAAREAKALSASLCAKPFPRQQR